MTATLISLFGLTCAIAGILTIRSNVMVSIAFFSISLVISLVAILGWIGAQDDDGR